MLKVLVLVSGLLFNLSELKAMPFLKDKNDSLFISGNKDLFLCNYHSALVGYQELEKNGIHTANLYNNIGVAFYKNRQWALAYLNFKKGMLITPLDDQLIRNANNSLQKLDTPTRNNNLGFDSKNREFFKSNNDINKLAVLFLLIGILLFILRFVSSSNKTRKFIGNASKSLIIVFLILTIIIWFDIKYHWSKKYMLTVNSHTCLYLGPTPLSGTDNYFTQGYEVEILNYYDGWYEIKDFENRTGWIYHKDLVDIN